MSEFQKPREPLSPEQIKENLDNFLSNVIATVAERGTEDIKIKLIFIANRGLHINCYFKDDRKIMSLGTSTDTQELIEHDKNQPFAAKMLLAAIGKSENKMLLRSTKADRSDERLAEIDLANPIIVKNMAFVVEKD